MPVTGKQNVKLAWNVQRGAGSVIGIPKDITICLNAFTRMRATSSQATGAPVRKLIVFKKKLNVQQTVDSVTLAGMCQHCNSNWHSISLRASYSPIYMT